MKEFNKKLTIEKKLTSTSSDNGIKNQNSSNVNSNINSNHNNVNKSIPSSKPK